LIIPAKQSHVLDILALGKRCYAEMNFDDVGYIFDEDHIFISISKSINNPKFVLLVSVNKKQKLDGVLWLTIQDTTLYFTGRKFAQEIAWHSDPDLPSFSRGKIMLELLQAGIKQLESLGIKNMYLSTDLDPKFTGVGRYLKKHGFNKMCEYWHKGV
jgi:hypothetical protein